MIDNPKTIEALEYAKELYATFIPGTLAWLDPSNNKAFLAGDIAPDAQRRLDLLRGQELERPGAEGNGRGHRPRQLPGRAGRQSDARVRSSSIGCVFKLHEVPERRPRVSALHDGGRSSTRRGSGVHRLLVPSAQGLRRQPGLDPGPESDRLPGHHAATPCRRATRAARAGPRPLRPRPTSSTPHMFRPYAPARLSPKEQAAKEAQRRGRALLQESRRRTRIAGALIDHMPATEEHAA